MKFVSFKEGAVKPKTERSSLSVNPQLVFRLEHGEGARPPSSICHIATGEMRITLRDTRSKALTPIAPSILPVGKTVSLKRVQGQQAHVGVSFEGTFSCCVCHGSQGETEPVLEVPHTNWTQARVCSCERLPPNQVSPILPLVVIF